MIMLKEVFHKNPNIAKNQMGENRLTLRLQLKNNASKIDLQMDGLEKQIRNLHSSPLDCLGKWVIHYGPKEWKDEYCIDSY